MPKKQKLITIRWPEAFWKQVAHAAIERETSVQALVTEAVARKLGLEIKEEK